LITEALQHCEGIGPVRLSELHTAGVRSWWSALDNPSRIPESFRAIVVSECCRCIEAMQARDVRYFVDRLLPQDKWRVLSHYFDDASFFDIETTGLDYDAQITVIVCWHQGTLHTFVEGENLDDFLDLLDEITLLVSFNGSSFDVPRVLDAFHIPQLPCPHLDLRWVSYHQNWIGSLKDIADRLDVPRPADLQDVDGAMAVLWWDEWQHSQDQSSLQRLIRYCSADVLLLVALAHHLAGQDCPPTSQLWSALPPAPLAEMVASPQSESKRPRARLLRLFRD
jgi:hypothetical protein